MKVSTRILSFLLVMVLMISAIPMNVFAASEQILGVAFVDATSLRLRSEASTSSKSLDTAKNGEVVVVLGKEGDWYKVIYDLQEGYMHSDYLELESAENVELGYGKVTGSNVNLRSGAGTSNKKVATASKGDKAYIIGVNNGWYKVIYSEKICYIRSDYLELTEVPYENRSSSNSPKFYKNGKSTGVEPSASALNGTTSAGNTTVTEPEETKPSNTTSSSQSSASSSKDSGVMYGVAYVTGSSLRLRSEASTSSKSLATARKGEVVVVVSKQGDWYKVIYDLKEGYMHGDYLNVKTAADVELGYGKVTGSSVNMRSGPSTSNKAVTVAAKGNKAYIIGINNGWYKVIYGSNICYIRSDYLQLTEVPYENQSSSNSPKFFKGGNSTGVTPSASALNGSSSSTSSGSSSSTGSSSGSTIVETAKKYLGTPYKWGGTTPSSGFDCSGFVYYVFNSVGIKLSRTISTMYKQGTPVAKSELQPGDIVFFQGTYTAGLSHVGIYVGDGKFIHSPHTGKVVSYANLYSSYYVNHYYGAVRMT